MILIKNLRNERCLNEWDVRVDRFNKILGNKFYMSNESMRDYVCDAYREWLYKEIKNNNLIVINELKRLKDIYLKYNRLNLFCWCAPRRCHAEEIKNVLEMSLRKEN